MDSTFLLVCFSVILFCTTVEATTCEGVTCHQRAYCEQTTGKCQCNLGYIGDGQQTCNIVETEGFDEALAQDDKDRVLAGIAAGQTLADVLTSYSAGNDIQKTARNIQKFARGLSRIASVISPILPFAGAVFSLATMFPPPKNEVLEEMKKAFREVNDKLDHIEALIEGVNNHIDWAFREQDVRRLTMAIKTKSDSIEELLLYPSNTPAYNTKKAAIIDAYDADLTLRFLNYVKASRFFSTYRSYVREHRGKVQNLCKSILYYLVQSSKVDMAVYNLQGRSAQFIRIRKGILDDYFRQIQTLMISQDDAVKNQWGSQWQTDVPTFSQEHMNLHHQAFANSLLSHLEDKYPWQSWFVASFESMGGNHDEFFVYGTLDSSSKYTAWETNQRNLVVANMDRATPLPDYSQYAHVEHDMHRGKVGFPCMRGDTIKYSVRRHGYNTNAPLMIAVKNTGNIKAASSRRTVTLSGDIRCQFMTFKFDIVYFL